MGILTQNTRDLSTTQKPPKIPDYAKDYKNEYLFIRGIDQCFKYFADNFETNSKHGDFFTKKFQRMTKYIRQSEYHQGLFNLKTTCRLFEPNDIHYAYDLYKKKLLILLKKQSLMMELRMKKNGKHMYLKIILGLIK